MSAEETVKSEVVLTANTDQYAKQMNSAANATASAVTAVTSLITGIDKLMKNSGRTLNIISGTTVATITAATVAAGRFESQLSSLEARSVVSGTNFGRLRNSVDTLRRDFPLATEQVIALAESLQKMGVAAPQVEKTAQSLIKLSGATGEDLGSLATNMVSLQRAMGTNWSSTEKFSSSVTKLSAEMGVSANGVLAFSNALSPIARTVGMSQTEVMGFSAAFQKAGQDSNAAANVFTSVLTDISRATRYGSPQLGVYSDLLGVTTEKFKEMSSSEQVTGFFEAINKQGEGAINTLERLGMDGPRSLRAVQAVAQSGGIGEALGIAGEGYKDTSSLDKGAEAAFGGFNDSLTRVRNNLTSVSQEFGRQFLPAASGVVDMFASMASGAASLMRALSPLAAVATTLGTALTGIAGFGMSNLGMLSAAGLAMSVARSPLAAGFMGARGGGSRVNREMNARYADGGGSGMGRRFWSAGAFAGRMMPVGAQQFDRDGNPIGSRMARLGMGISGVYQGALRFGQTSIDPIRLRDQGRRFASVGEERTRAGQAWGNLGRRIGFMGPAQGFGENNYQGSRDAFSAARTGQGASMGVALSGAARATGAFATAVSSATLGLGRLGLATGGTLLRRGASSAMSGISGLMGGPWGVGIAAALGTGMAVNSVVQGNAERRQEYADNPIGQAAINVYADALGEAGQAAVSFSQKLRDAEDMIVVNDKDRANKITDEDIVAASAQGRDYTNARIEKMSETQAKAYYSSIFAENSSSSLAQRQSSKIDLIDRYGAEFAEQVIASANDQTNSADIINRGGNNNPFTTRGGFALDANTNESFKEAIGFVESRSADIYAKNGAESADAYRNAEIRNLFNSINADTDPNVEQATLAAIETLAGYGGDKGGFGIAPNDMSKIFGNRYTDEGNRYGNEAWGSFLSTIAESENGRKWLEDNNVGLGASGYGPASGGGGGGWGGSNDPGDRGSRSRSGMFNGDGSSPGSFGAVDWRTITNEAESLPPTAAASVGIGALGRSRYETAQQEVANPNLQLGASQGWANALMQSTNGDSAQAYSMLQTQIDSSADADGPAAQFAKLAQSRVQRDMGYKLPSMTSGEQGQYFAQSMVNAAAANKDGSEYWENLTTAQDQFMNWQESARQRLATIVRSYREFDISQARSGADLNTSLGRGRADFSRSKSRSNADFALSNSRGREDFGRQRERSEFDFDLQKSQSSEDYYRSMGQQEEDYQRGRMRADVEFNISRQQQLSDFNRQRVWQEEDFQHQQLMMTRQTSRSIQDIYSRITIKPTWDSKNLMVNAREQLAAMQKQQEDLGKLRGMGMKDEAITQLGLNEFGNADQLSRFVSDVQGDPKQIEEWNKLIADRIDATEKFVTDSANTSYTEMVRSFELAAKRSEETFQLSISRTDDARARSLAQQDEDYKRSVNRSTEMFAIGQQRNDESFARSMARMDEDFKRQMSRSGDDYAKMMARQNEDYERSVSRTVEDWNKSMGRAREDLNRSFEETTGTFGELHDQAIGLLTGTTQAQVQAMNTNMTTVKGELVRNLGGISDEVIKALVPLFGTEEAVRAAFGLNAKGTNGRGGGLNMKMMAEGGPVDGYSPHKQADNIPTMLTAGEYVQPVDAVNYYGKDYMDSLRQRKIPRGDIPDTAYEKLLALDPSKIPGQKGGTWQSTAPVIGVVPAQDGAWKRPTAGPITSNYGPRWGAFHNGIDIAGGGPTFAANSGVVRRVGWNVGYGNTGIGVLLAHGGGLESYYGHNPEGGVVVSAGQQVSAGQHIGRQGATGNVTGVHLHYSVFMNGKAINPSDYGISGGVPSLVGGGSGGTVGGGVAGGMTGLKVLATIIQSKKLRETEALLGKTPVMDWAMDDGRLSMTTGIGMLGRAADRGNKFAADGSIGATKWFRRGGLFSNAQTIGVGEAGPEAVLPLDHHGVDFLHALMNKFSVEGADERGVRSGVPITPASVTYNQHIDQGQHYHGDFTVQSSDPNEMFAKLQEKARMERLVRG